MITRILLNPALVVAAGTATLASPLQAQAPAQGFIDSQWFNVGGLPGFNDEVLAIARDEGADDEEEEDDEDDEEEEEEEEEEENPQGRVFFGGKFTAVGDVDANRVVMWDGETFTPLGDGLNGTVRGLHFDPDSGMLYAGGEFTSAGDGEAYGIAVWDGSVWSTLGDALRGQPGWINDISVFEGQVYVGGLFQEIGGVSAHNVARWDAQDEAWSKIGSGRDTGTTKTGWSSFSGEVRDMESTSSTLTIVGDFIAVNEMPANRVARWNGETWSALGDGLGRANLGAFSVAVSGGGVYVGGDFERAGGVEVNNVARWNGTAWSAIGEGVSGLVKSLDLYGTQVFVGGQFQSASGVPASNIAYWSGTDWNSMGHFGADNTVNEILIASDLAQILIAGPFESVGGKDAPNVARGVNLPAPEIEGTGRMLLIDNEDGFGPTAEILTEEGFDVTEVVNETVNDYENLLDASFLEQFDLVVYCERAASFGAQAGSLMTEEVRQSLEDYIQGGGNLLVTGHDTLGFTQGGFNSDLRCAQLVRAANPADQISNNPTWAVGEIDSPILNGPFGDFTGETFNATGYDDDFLNPNEEEGAIELVATGEPRVTSKIIFTDIPEPGGSVGYWNGGFSAPSDAQPDFNDGGEPQAIFLNWAASVVPRTIELSPVDHFLRAALNAGLSGASQTAPNAIPFGDGVTNLEKYAFNMNLSRADAGRMEEGGDGGLPFSELVRDPEGDFFRVEFVRRKDAGLVYAPQKSENLADFEPFTSEPVVTDIDDTWERVVYEEPVDRVTFPTSFFAVDVAFVP